jgi:hypothetical protein
MNRLSIGKQAQIAAMMVEGVSVRAITRMTGASKNTVAKMLGDFGGACIRYHDAHVRNVRVRRLQCDEIWSFVGCKQKNATPEQKLAGWGDIWTWTAIDADTKLCLSYLVGGRYHALRVGCRTQNWGSFLGDGFCNQLHTLGARCSRQKSRIAPASGQTHGVHSEHI